MVHTVNLSTGEVVAGRSLNLKLVWSTSVPGQQGPHPETLSQTGRKEEEQGDEEEEEEKEEDKLKE